MYLSFTPQTTLPQVLGYFTSSGTRLLMLLRYSSTKVLKHSGSQVLRFTSTQRFTSTGILRLLYLRYSSSFTPPSFLIASRRRRSTQVHRAWDKHSKILSKKCLKNSKMQCKKCQKWRDPGYNLSLKYRHQGRHNFRTFTSLSQRAGFLLFRPTSQNFFKVYLLFILHS